MKISALIFQDIGRYTVKNTEDDSDSDAVILLAGPGHPARLDSENKAGRNSLREFNKKGKALLPEDPQELFANETERLATLTLGWENVCDANGEAIPFSKEKVAEFYADRHCDLRAQVVTALANKQLFMKKFSPK